MNIKATGPNIVKFRGFRWEVPERDRKRKENKQQQQKQVLTPG